jgi:CubicO group peptidase (beta-lactamase class C family)
MKLIEVAFCGLLLTSNIGSQEQAVINPALPIYDSSDLSAKLAAIEKAVEEKRLSLNVPGAALVIVKDDRVVLLKGFGLRDVEARLPVTPETLFAIGSCTKTFTALAAVISADEGKLSLDDSPKMFLPYFKLRDPEADAQVTLRDLLSHRTGLKAHGNDDAWKDARHRREEVIRIAMQSKPTAKLREKYQYNNVMYIAAGEAVARAQNATWEEVITSRIFRPLGMSASNFSVSAMQQTAEFSRGYDRGKKRKQAPMRNLDSAAPAGAINSNAKEMGQWLRLLLGGGIIDGKRLVSEKGFREMMTKQAELDKLHYYGLGLEVGEYEDWPGHPLYYHEGNTKGFGAAFVFIPDQKLGFAILTNVTDSELPNAIGRIVIRNLADLS